MKGETVKISLAEAYPIIQKVNPNFAKTLTRLRSKKDIYLYKISYPFGASIINNGVFNLPDANGEIVPITDNRIHARIRADLTYNQNGLPVGIVTKNSYELFIDTSKTIIPVLAAQAGSVVALWRQLDGSSLFHPTSIFSAVAGARSLFLVPNVGDAMQHKNLIRSFNVKKHAPKNLLDQWEIFRAIAGHEKNNWRLELILMPKQWMEKTTKDEEWRDLYLYMLKNGWASSSFERNQIFYEFALSCAQANRRARANPYLLDTVRHLLSVILGATPGFKAATDETMGPIELIQKAYVDIYGLDKYAPTMMHPAHFNVHDNGSKPVYYSFQLPTTISFSARSKQLTSTLYDIKELKYIMDFFIEELLHKKVHLENTILDRIPLLSYQYFHSNPDLRDDILSTAQLAKTNPDMLHMLYQKSSKKFAYNGTFVRGCIQIGHSTK